MAHKVGSKPRESSRKAHRRSRPKRRVDLVLPADMGAEVRLPAVPEVRAGARLLTFLLLVGMLWACYFLLTGSSFRVDQAAIHGSNFMTEAQVRSIAQVDGTPVFMVDPGEVVERLMSYPEFSEAAVSVEWPNKVVIDLKERTPLIAWDDGGRKWWLCENGVAFLEREALPGMIQVVSNEPVLQIQEDPLAQVIDPQVLQSAITLSTLLPETGQLIFDPVWGWVLEDTRGWKVYFGLAGDMGKKARVYAEIGNWLQDQGGVVSMVSVADPHSPYYGSAR
jgi:cell division septal protein FtsQ